MKKVSTVILALFVLVVWAHAQDRPARYDEPRQIFLGFRSGYWAGSGGGAQVSVRRLSRDVPISICTGGSYSYVFDPGNAEDARRIFVNDNQGGTIKKYGANLLVFFDVGYELLRQTGVEYHFFAGPRYTRFTGHYAFIGDNEAFDVTADLFGVGGGAHALVYLSDRWHLSLTAGGDYYAPSRLSGHGKYSYTPDGVDDTPRNDYTYEDADEAVNQPTVVPRVELGIHLALSP